MGSHLQSKQVDTKDISAGLILCSVLSSMQQSTLVERGEARKAHVWPSKESLFSDSNVLFFLPANWFLSIPVLPLAPGSQHSISDGCFLIRSAHSQASWLNRFMLNLATGVDNFFLQYGGENRECVFYSRKLQTKERTQSRV